MSNEYAALSEHELASVIESAQRALKEKMDVKRREVIQQIKELASSINLSVDIRESGDVGGRVSSRKGTKVAAKYQNPYNHAQTWSGRGMKPKWLTSLLESGRSMNEFEIG
jgi:DNA-binding protein H-NS